MSCPTSPVKARMMLVTTALLLLGEAWLDAASEPPSLPSSRHWESREVSLGRDVSLRCPISASLYRWYHRDTEITQPAGPPYHPPKAKTRTAKSSTTTCLCCENVKNTSLTTLLSFGRGVATLGHTQAV